jgi:hypothetical protein
MTRGVPLRAPSEATTSEMGAHSAPEDPPLGIVERPFDPRRDSAWMDDAVCANVGAAGDIFAPEKGVANEVPAALRACRFCTVQVECGTYALTHGLDGVWGGTTGRQRRKAVRQSRAARAAVAA